MPRLVQRWGVGASIALLLLSGAPTASAHLFQWESQTATQGSLMGLFPTADPRRFKVKRHRFHSAELQRLRDRGIELPRAQRDATFYIAYDSSDNLVGVAMFLAPQSSTAPAGSLRLGVAVDASGRIHRIEVFDREGRARLGRGFLAQLEGRDLSDSFEVDGVHLRATDGSFDDCQRVANAGREAIELMQVALGRSG